MVKTATAGNRVFLSVSKAWNGFSSVEQLGFGSLDKACERRTVTRCSREHLEKVKRRALTCQNASRVSLERKQHIVGGEGIAISLLPHDFDIRVYRGKNSIHKLCAAKNPCFACDYRRRCLFVAIHQPCSDVATADILVEGEFYDGVNVVLS